MRTGSLTAEEIRRIEQARRTAYLLYEGRLTPHRSCGVCLAETFGLPWRPYQALRRGGITGEGSCGAIRAGELILGELLGPDSPTAPPGDRLREAILYYQARWREIQQSAGWPDTICNTLTRPLGDFFGESRTGFCTTLAADVAAVVAETLIRMDHSFEVTIVPEAAGEASVES
jgi:hypothetical protein